MISGASVPNPSRRALLRGRARARLVLRPPGALSPLEFASACTRCDACLPACPEGIVIRGEGGFPELDFSRGECTFCGECEKACEPRALDAERAPPWDWRALIGSSCIARKGVICQSCRDVCPTRAITFPIRVGVALPLLDTDLCSGCGACVGMCPPGAISMTPMTETS